jgi:hypothetical protein
MKTRNMAAVDLGASSGRVLLVHFDGRALSVEEMIASNARWCIGTASEYPEFVGRYSRTA